VHQCAQFASKPNVEYDEAVMIYSPIMGKDVEVYADASLCGDWNTTEANTDNDTTLC
jgi:hypothetical protein